MIRRNARTDASSVTATRTLSHPSRARERIWAMVARTSRVSVFVMLWTETGALPPTYTFPTRVRRGGLLFFFVALSVTAPRATGAGYTGGVRATDPDGDPVSIRPKSLPEGVTLSGTAVSWEESAVPQGSEIPVVLLVSDGDGGDIEYVFRISR